MRSFAATVFLTALICSAQLKLSPTFRGLSLTFLQLSPAHAQAPPRDAVAPPAVGNARINGRVITADTGNPIARAQVHVNSPALAKPRQAVTDATGRYEITGLPAGRYKVSVSRLGFVALEHGQTRPFEPGRDLEVLDGQTIDGVNFALSRGGVITGRVTDHNGEPQAGIGMSALRFVWAPSGARNLERTSFGLFSGIVTDDLGQFRIYGLMPGSYVVAAGTLPGVLSGLPSTSQVTTYYPGTANADEAQSVDVEMGQEVSVHFSLVSARLARITGTILDSGGRPLGWRSIMLGTRAESGSAFRGAGTTRPDGTFEISDVAPGNYTIEVSPLRTEPSDHEFVSFPITVDGQDITDLTISARRGANVTGRVIWEGTSPQPFATLRVSIVPADPRFVAGRMSVGGGSDHGVVDAKGHFTISGVNGHVVFRPSFTGRSETWNLKAVRFGGADITDAGYHVSSDVDGVEVIMTDRETRVSGTARDARNQPATDYVAVFLPSEIKPGINMTRFMQTARPDQQGRYQAKGLPPGQYVAAAVESLVRDGHFDPEFQKRVRAIATPFTLKEGQDLPLDLTLMK